MGRWVGVSFSCLVVGDWRGGEGTRFWVGDGGLLLLGANGCRKVGMLRTMRRLRNGLRI